VVDLIARHSLAQSTISHHLGILMASGLVRQERRGTYSLYRVDAEAWEEFRQYTAALGICRGPGNTSAAFHLSGQ
jgi:ArsR family transcriptional regulator